MGGISADLRGIGTELKMVSRKFQSEVRSAVRKAVAEAGAEMVAKVKESALSEGLHQAADATYIRPNFTLRSAGVRIVVSRAKAPYARPMEMGNKGGSESVTTFTNGTGGVVRKRPFFFKATEALTPEAEALMAAAITEAVRKTGFR